MSLSALMLLAALLTALLGESDGGLRVLGASCMVAGVMALAGS